MRKTGTRSPQLPSLQGYKCRCNSKIFECCITLYLFSFIPQDIKLTSSNDDDYFVFEDVLCQVRTENNASFVTMLIAAASSRLLIA